MRCLKSREGEYEPPKIEIISVAAEQGFAGSADPPYFDEPEVLRWDYNHTTE